MQLSHIYIYIYNKSINFATRTFYRNTFIVYNAIWLLDFWNMKENIDQHYKYGSTTKQATVHVKSLKFSVNKHSVCK